MKEIQITRGQIVWVELEGQEGSVQKGRRPYVVVSNNKANTYSPVILGAPLTSSSRKKKLPTHVSVSPEQENGLKRDSLVTVEQIFPISKDSILSVVGQVSEGVMNQVNEALKVSLAL